MRNFCRSTALAGLLSATGAAALAAPVVTLGYDASANKTVVADHAPALARASFEAAISNLGGPSLREDMEGMTVSDLQNKSPIGFSFGSVTGTAVTPSNEAVSGPASGVFNTTSGGAKFIDATGDVTISFGQALSGFGLYLTDLGDFNGAMLTATLALVGGGTAQVNVQRGGENAGLLFFGVLESDLNVRYSSITFNTSADAGNPDVFGMDDFVGVARAPDGQIPVPSTITLLWAGLMALGASGRRRGLRL
jgi:hypothetical protein